MTHPDHNTTTICSTGSLAGYSLAARFRLARDAGAGGVELLLSPKLAKIEPRRIREIEDASGVAVRSVHTVLRLHHVSSDVACADIRDSARLAGQLRHCDVLVVHPPQIDSLHDSEARSWLQAVEDARELSERARFRVTIENAGRMSRNIAPSFFDHPKHLRRLTEEWDLGITLDTAHAGSRHWDLLEVTEIFGPRLANVHLSDCGETTHRWSLANALLRDHRLPGEGTLPLDALMDQLAAARYTGLVTLELSPLAVRSWWPPLVRTRLHDAVQRAKLGPDSVRQPTQQSA